MPPLRVFVIAGETSGDIHAASLIREIRRLRPDAIIEGLGGPRMEAAGCRLLTNMLDQFDIMWFGKLAGSVKKLRALQRMALDHMDRERPDVVVPVDYPGFNLMLARWIKRRGIPVVYYIPPQIWAWWLGRWKKLKKRTAKLLVIFPFEQALYEGFGIPVSYVGHPMFDHIDHVERDASFDVTIRKGHTGPLIALMPGTRRQHIMGKLPLMLKTARRLLDAGIEARFVIPCVDEARRALIDEVLARFDVPVEVTLHRTYELMRGADLAIAASGSTTLELAHFRTPMVVVYRVSRFDMVVARLLKRSPLIAMINVLAGREIVPEFLLSSDRDDLVAAAALDILQTPGRRETMLADIDETMTPIEKPGASARAAEEVVRVAEGEGQVKR